MRRILSKALLPSSAAAGVVSSGFLAAGASSAVAVSSSSAFPSSLSPAHSMSYRFASSSSTTSPEQFNAMEESNNQGYDNAGDDNDAISTNVNDAGDDDFDYVEASCQEIHDTVGAMKQHVHALGGPLKANGRSGASNPRHYHAALQNRGQHYRYRTAGEAIDGQKKFGEDYERLMQHLTLDVWNRILSSSSKFKNNLIQSSRGGKHSANQQLPLRLFSSTSYHGYFAHAPHEALQLRSDIPSFVVENARCMRDSQTISDLKFLARTANHEYQQKLMEKLYELTEAADKVDTTHMNRTSGLSKPFGESEE